MSVTDTSTIPRLDDMVRRIVDGFHPDRIILFGSHARGESILDSDMELLVVMPVNGSRRRLAVEIGAALTEVPFPKDIMVTIPEDFAWRKDVTGTIEYPAAHEGRVLYVIANNKLAEEAGWDSILFISRSALRMSRILRALY
uniref:Nucleotidyltransferase domain-containing protein n=1 Tax=Candidatus Kentrum sp. TUN TaxID=2126343 RepID=A0A450ZTN4_9GAMM|nr:MAG: Nucleotidyltransferase domain-containing protein [Candidatus Kentron sp. TUN]VFK65101.1 MAG: Nucleotidyltransferase domain-containing protein [Candidatus Kentron sp. TUN]VFK65390.1 MAG: Nucleotidyltransferase domain-containing protein [Candidatus Kentron sp. TUN]